MSGNKVKTYYKIGDIVGDDLPAVRIPESVNWTIPLLESTVMSRQLSGDELYAWVGAGSQVYFDSFPDCKTLIDEFYLTATNETETIMGVTLSYKQATNGWRFYSEADYETRYNLVKDSGGWGYNFGFDYCLTPKKSERTLLSSIDNVKAWNGIAYTESTSNHLDLYSDGYFEFTLRYYKGSTVAGTHTLPLPVTAKNTEYIVNVSYIHNASLSGNTNAEELNNANKSKTSIQFQIQTAYFGYNVTIKGFVDNGVHKLPSVYKYYRVGNYLPYQLANLFVSELPEVGANGVLYVVPLPDGSDHQYERFHWDENNEVFVSDGYYDISTNEVKTNLPLLSKVMHNRILGGDDLDYWSPANSFIDYASNRSIESLITEAYGRAVNDGLKTTIVNTVEYKYYKDPSSKWSFAEDYNTYLSYLTNNGNVPMFCHIEDSGVWTPKDISRILIYEKKATDEDPTYYTVYSDGWVEQGGRTSTNGIISSTNKRINLYVTMNSNIYHIDVACNANSANATVVPGWENTTSFSIGSITGITTGIVWWEVKGYADLNFLTENFNLHIEEFEYYLKGNAIVNQEITKPVVTAVNFNAPLLKREESNIKLNDSIVWKGENEYVDFTLYHNSDNTGASDLLYKAYLRAIQVGLQTETINGINYSYYVDSSEANPTLGTDLRFAFDLVTYETFLNNNGYVNYWYLNSSTGVTGDIWTPKELNRRLIDRKEATDSDNYWYNLYSDGWIEQGGYRPTVAANVYDSQYKLPITMKDTNYIISTNIVGTTTSGTTDYGLQWLNPSVLSTSIINFPALTSAYGAKGRSWTVTGYVDTSLLTQFNFNKKYYYYLFANEADGITVDTNHLLSETINKLNNFQLPANIELTQSLLERKVTNKKKIGNELLNWCEAGRSYDLTYVSNAKAKIQNIYDRAVTLGVKIENVLGTEYNYYEDTFGTNIQFAVSKEDYDNRLLNTEYCPYFYYDENDNMIWVPKTVKESGSIVWDSGFVSMPTFQNPNMTDSLLINHNLNVPTSELGNYTHEFYLQCLTSQNNFEAGDIIPVTFAFSADSASIQGPNSGVFRSNSIQIGVSTAAAAIYVSRPLNGQWLAVSLADTTNYKIKCVIKKQDNDNFYEYYLMANTAELGNDSVNINDKLDNALIQLQNNVNQHNLFAIEVSSWNVTTKQVVVPVEGILEDTLLLVSPAPASTLDYHASGIFVIEQGIDYIILQCFNNIPTQDITIDVVKLGLLAS